VHQLATQLDLDGALVNGSDGVLVELAGSRQRLECFLRRLGEELPAPARLEPPLPQWGPATMARGQGVRIDAGAREPLGVGWLAPALAADRAPCAECLAELDDPASRRFGDPFISCARCGPRYSIAVARPYRRCHTTLASFDLCDACRREFEDPADRRFHAETLGCPRCGPRLSLVDGRGQAWSGPGVDPLAAACGLLAAGRILALQGVGGFQLLVDAGHQAALALLRQRKRRPAKPFALLVADEASLEAGLWIDAAERSALRDGAAPIVLLRRRPALQESWPGVASGSPALGVMRPASPLHHLLVRRFGRPLVATSGNRSGEPLCIDPLEARQRLAGIADAFLLHDRPIARPLDDSLLQVIEGQPVLLRRARGYAPEPLPLPAADPAYPGLVQPLLALSGDRKCAPALALGDRLWLAPHLGDLADGLCQQRLVRGLSELIDASDGSPSASHRPPLTLICDAHPGYVSHQWARSSGLPMVTVQHHLAHGLAVIAEHGLEPPVLVGAFDGLGYGEPLPAGASFESPQQPSSGSPASHQLWGGELLLIRKAVAGDGRDVSNPSDNGSLGGAERCLAGALEPRVGQVAEAAGPVGAGWLGNGQSPSWGRSEGSGAAWRAEHLGGLRPFPLPGGERALGEPRRSALGLLLAVDALDHPGAWRVRQAFAGEDLTLLQQAVSAGCQAPLCSSAGRLFDGVASLLGLVQVLSYEGEGGLRLQGAAARALPWPDQGAWDPLMGDGSDDPLPLLPPGGSAGSWRLDWQPLLFRVLDAVAAETPLEVIAARFHHELAEGLAIALTAWADRLGLAADQRRVALAGGCFQNRLLLEATAAGLRRRGMEPWWSQRLPANDGGLALGQVWAGRHGLAIQTK